MSVRTVNVGLLNPLKLLDLGELTEGPPFYSELRIKLEISGSRSIVDLGLTYSESFNFSKEVTFSRAPLELDTDGIDFPNAEDGLVNFDFDSVFFVTPVEPASGDFCVATVPWSKSSPASPQQTGRQALSLFYATTFTPEVCGTWSITGNPDPADDTSGDIEISAFPIPSFALSTGITGPLDYRKPYDEWEAYIEIPSVLAASTGDTVALDISGWTNAEWRSKLGVHSVTYNDSGWYGVGSTSNAEATFEWELS